VHSQSHDEDRLPVADYLYEGLFNGDDDDYRIRERFEDLEGVAGKEKEGDDFDFELLHDNLHEVGYY
jgi:hypothetical protein